MLSARKGIMREGRKRMFSAMKGKTEGRKEVNAKCKGRGI